jgi:hypothetical protein
MSQPRPTHDQISAAVAVAQSAVAAAAAVRKRYHRRRSPQRESALVAARTRCEDAAKPLRSWIGMAAWGGIELDDELAMKKQMEALRYERRQIAKML